jgi:ElaB/YqjD/DUF883 family membrane-anchored ribosome-binding protein
MSTAQKSVPQAIRQNLDGLRDDVGVLKSDLIDTVQDAVQIGKSEAKRVVQTVAQRGQSATEAAQEYVAQRPIRAVAVAFGVGILVGAALRK